MDNHIEHVELKKDAVFDNRFLKRSSWATYFD